MRIGGFPSLPPFLPKSSGNPTADVRPESASKDRNPQSAPIPADWTERVQQADSRAFYTTDRDLPFSGRAAIDTYLTNSNLSWPVSGSELLGIDLYA